MEWWKYWGAKGRTEVHGKQEIRGQLRDDRKFGKMTFYSSGRLRLSAIGPGSPFTRI
jgi:hypothetical protein